MRSLGSQLIEYESMLHVSVQRVGRAVRNMRQEMGGYGSRTPGSGEPGSGKNSRPTVHISDRGDENDQGDRVPITAVEMQALGFTELDAAAQSLEQLRRSALAVVFGLGRAAVASGVDLGVAVDQVTPTPGRLVVFAYARVRRLQQVEVFTDPDRTLDQLRMIDGDVEAVYHRCQNWGYVPGRPRVPKARADLLAVDLTERWCTSHLRLGVKRPRSRGELCDWCYRTGPLLVPTWDAPPLALVRLHVDHGKVYAHQVDPFLQAERDRQRNLAKAAR